MLLDFLMKNKIKLILGVVILSILVSLFWLFTLLNQDVFYKGIRIEGIDVSGLTKKHAKTLVDEKLNKIIEQNSIVLKHGENSWEIPLHDISYNFLVNEAVDAAYRAGREGNLIDRIKDIYNLRSHDKNIIVQPSISREKLSLIIKTIKGQVDKKEKDASATYKYGNMKFVEEIVGESIDVDKNVNGIINKIEKRDFSSIVLDVQKIYPKVMLSDISDIKDVIASFSTSFNSNKINRSHNIKLACERINNKLLLPGEIFSMDKALGSRTIQNGYKNAPVIIKGQLIEGTGGGVCQVTTTLYVSVLKAKLKVVERTPHSMPLSYVPPGQDATIAEGYIDFKFENSNKHALLINAEVVGNRILIRLIGKKEATNHSVQLKTVVLEESTLDYETVIDDTLPDGDRVVEREASKGLKVAVYREIYENGKLAEKEKVSEDIYKSVKGLIRVSPTYNYNSYDVPEYTE